MLRKIMVIGHAGQDAQLRFTPTGRAVVNFSVAVNERWKDASGDAQERTEWFRVEGWDKFAENVSELVTKGRLVYVEGIPSVDTWTDAKDNSAKGQIRIRANIVRLLDRKPDEGEAAPAEQIDA